LLIRILSPVDKIKSSKDVLQYAKAASAFPFAYKPVSINGEHFSDIGAMIDPLPVKRALEDGYDEVLAVYNKPKWFRVPRKFQLVKRIFSPFLPVRYRKIIKLQEKTWNNLEDFLEEESSITVIRPDRKTPIDGVFDTDRTRIHRTVDMGIKDGERYINTLKKSS